MSRYAGVIHLALVFLVSSGSACALDPSLFLTQYIHTTWVQREESVMPSVRAIAQTSDGYLWLGTSNGLFQFDGFRLIPWRPAVGGDSLPSSEIVALQASANGGLWVATRLSVSYLADRRLTNYTMENGLPKGSVAALLDDPERGLWVAIAGSETGLALIRNDKIQAYGNAEGFPTAGILALLKDPAGNLWLGGEGLCQWRPGQRAACRNLPAEVVALQQDKSAMLAVDVATRSVYSLAGGNMKPLVQTLGTVNLAPKTLLKDSDGNVWLGTLGQGLFRIKDGTLQRFTRRDGLSSDVIQCIFEDRERNLWVGTATGLDRLRDPKVAKFSTLEGLASDLVTAVYSTRDGSTWIGTAGGGLDRWAQGNVSHYQIGSGLPSTTVLSLHEDSLGRVWAGTTGGLSYFQRGRFTEVRSCDSKPVNRVFAIVGDERGNLWMADGREGLLRSNGNCLVHAPGIPGVTDRTDIYALQCDRRGGLWVGYYGGGLLRLDPAGAPRRFTSRDGLAGGAVEAIYEDGRGSIWAGTTGGLSRLRGGHWTTWTVDQGIPEGGVLGIIEDDQGQLWMQTSAGLLHVPLMKLAVPGTPDFLYTGAGDAVRFGNGGQMAYPRLTKSKDGRLWFSTKEGVAIVDPAKLRAPAPLPVSVQLRVDGKAIELELTKTIGVRGRELQFEYTALSLAAQDDIRFRYKLEGLDRDWTEAGTRRQIVYSNLAPGPYQFKVAARMSGGGWNEQATSLSLHMEPRFYQTVWFAGIVIVALGLLTWAIYWLRVRQLRERFQLVLQERTRLTREIHDTLLQGFAGVVYQLEASWRQFDSAPESSKRQLERALDQADRSLKEARQTITFLRLPMIENCDLSEILSTAGKQLTEDTPVKFEFTCTGNPQKLPYDVQWNLYALAREAMSNALKHAQPSRIQLEMACLEDSIQLVIQDDGLGFDQALAAGKQSRWGLRSMRERAGNIGGTLNIVSSPGSGAKIEFKMPRRRIVA